MCCIGRAIPRGHPIGCARSRGERGPWLIGYSPAIELRRFEQAPVEQHHRGALERHVARTHQGLFENSGGGECVSWRSALPRGRVDDVQVARRDVVGAQERNPSAAQ